MAINLRQPLTRINAKRTAGKPPSAKRKPNISCPPQENLYSWSMVFCMLSTHLEHRARCPLQHAGCVRSCLPTLERELSDKQRSQSLKLFSQEKAGSTNSVAERLFASPKERGAPASRGQFEASCFEHRMSKTPASHLIPESLTPKSLILNP